MPTPIIIGAVLYDPKVSTIWEIIARFFEDNACPIDIVFYTNYELQVKALLSGHLDIAWNSPLAWLDAQRQSANKCRAIAMRDTDRDRSSYLVVRKDSGIKQLSDIRGKTIGLGAADSPQANLIPRGLLAQHGFKSPQDFTALPFNILVGKHGDHIGGELEAFQSLKNGASQASAMLDLNWEAWTQNGTVNDQEFGILAKTDKFDHCVFTVRNDFSAELEQRWLKVLFSMDYNNPNHKEMMDLEGLTQWLPGRTTGFGPLADAVSNLSFFA